MGGVKWEIVGSEGGGNSKGVLLVEKIVFADSEFHRICPDRLCRFS